MGYAFSLNGKNNVNRILDGEMSSKMANSRTRK
jgi:hypothetical protein